MLETRTSLVHSWRKPNERHEQNQLPYDFDLLYDCKTAGEVRKRLKWLQDTVRRYQREYQGLHKLAREHELNTNNLPEEFDDA